MDFGVSFATAAEHWKTARRAEALGFDYAWFSDTQLLNADMFVAMAAAAMETSRIRLGSAVAVPSNRIAPVTANALASLNKLAPGRIDFGISTGFTARRTMGRGAVPLAEMAEYIEVVKGLLDGDTVAWRDAEGTSRIRFLNPEHGLINIDDPVRFHVSAFGPKGRRLTARIGAGWMSAVGNLDRAAADAADMRDAMREAGRDPTELYATAITGGCVLAEGEAFDSERAKALAGPAAAVVLHNLVERERFGTIRLDLPGPPRPAIGTLPRALPELHAGGCALPHPASRPSPVPATGRGAADHRRADPPRDDHGNEIGAARGHPRAGRGGLHPVLLPHPLRPRGDAGRMGRGDRGAVRRCGWPEHPRSRSGGRP